jgi:tetratricopeptide (TPR) repeat protein
VLALHNQRGGVLIFGVRDGDLAFCGAKDRLDSKLFNDKIRRYVGDQIWVDFHREAIEADQRYLGLAIIPPRGPALGYFRADAPEQHGKREFREGESALRVGDSSIVLDSAKAAAHQASMTPGVAGSPYAIDQPFFRILALETHHFIPRPQLGNQLERALSDERTSVTSLIGIGGSGKTTLATWAALAAHRERKFSFVVSMTAKDRELTTSGIQSLASSRTTYESLLTQIADVLGFSELKELDLKGQETEIRALLENSNGLLYVDNLETVDDPRVITFLDDLPVGVRALVTSRRSSVRVAVRPIDVGPLSAQEARALIRSLRAEPGFSYVADLTDSEVDRVSDACDRLPLAVRWTLARAAGAAEAVQRADALRGANPRDDGQLLEFVFRRVFMDMTDVERGVMQTLSIFQEPSPAEVLIAGSGHEGHAVLDALEDLARDALTQRLFDADRNDYVFVLAPLTRSFVLNDLRTHRDDERKIRRRLTDWYEARDVRVEKDRVAVRELRQGRGSPEHALVDLARDAEKRGDYRTAQDLYEQALSRNPNSWEAARRYAEFERHVNRNHTRALELYERAGANAPSRGSDRALVHREWGMLLRDSGRPNATDDAIEKFEIARKETPNDPMLVHALASMYDRKGVYMKVIELLEPLRGHPSPKTRKRVLPLLLRAYQRTTQILEAAEVKRELDDMNAG